MTMPALSSNSAVIVRPDRTIQDAAAGVLDLGLWWLLDDPPSRGMTKID